MSDLYSVFDAAGRRVLSGAGRAEALERWHDDGRSGVVAREDPEAGADPSESASAGILVAPATKRNAKPAEKPPAAPASKRKNPVK